MYEKYGSVRSNAQLKKAKESPNHRNYTSQQMRRSPSNLEEAKTMPKEPKTAGIRKVQAQKKSNLESKWLNEKTNKDIENLMQFQECEKALEQFVDKIPDNFHEHSFAVDKSNQHKNAGVAWMSSQHTMCTDRSNLNLQRRITSDIKHKVIYETYKEPSPVVYSKVEMNSGNRDKKQLSNLQLERKEVSEFQRPVKEFNLEADNLNKIQSTTDNKIQNLVKMNELDHQNICEQEMLSMQNDLPNSSISSDFEQCFKEQFGKKHTTVSIVEQGSPREQKEIQQIFGTNKAQLYLKKNSKYQ